MFGNSQRRDLEREVRPTIGNQKIANVIRKFQNGESCGDKERKWKTTPILGSIMTRVLILFQTIMLYWWSK